MEFAQLERSLYVDDDNFDNKLYGFVFTVLPLNEIVGALELDYTFLQLTPTFVFILETS